jgi:hypothetical protein
VNSVRTVPTQPKLPVSNTEHAISKKRSREPSELVQESCSLIEQSVLQISVGDTVEQLLEGIMRFVELII